jgi:MoaA/NifB/PqqE/SkfB family radical SAM enzyme
VAWSRRQLHHHEPGQQHRGGAQPLPLRGVEKVYITPYGDVIPCPFIHVSFGNVRETPLTAIVQRMREVPRFGKYQDICVAAEDEEFQQKVMERVYDDGLPRPAPYERVAALFDD